jgi:WD40 repeat protein
LAASSNDGKVWLWNPATGEQVGEPLAGDDEGVDTLAFSPDGEQLACGGYNTVWVWNPITHEPIDW